MALFNIRWRRSAVKELKKLPQPVIVKILSTIETLADAPTPTTAVKLTGTKHTHRIRVGDYRLIYNVLNGVLTIEVVRVRHRKDAYRDIL